MLPGKHGQDPSLFLLSEQDWTPLPIDLLNESFAFLSSSLRQRLLLLLGICSSVLWEGRLCQEFPLVRGPQKAAVIFLFLSSHSLV